jgi:hypothetical protein
MPAWTPEQIATVAATLAALIGAIAAVVSAIFAGLALRAQHRAQRPHIKVTQRSGIPIFGMSGRSLVGSTPGPLWFYIRVHNDGLMPVTVQSASLVFGDEGTAPFFAQPWPGLSGLPATLAAGDSIDLYMDEVPKIALAHKEHQGARYVEATIGGGREFRSKPIKKKWLDGWAPKGPA